jgi:hypothetical protein
MATASAMGSAAANNGGVATVDNSDNSNNSDNSDNSYAEATDHSASANNGGSASIDNSDNSTNTDNSDNSGAWADGWGTSSANNGGTATTTYTVNESVLTGTVTDNTVAYTFGGASTMESSNIMTDSFNGNAGINQNVQNIGNNALTQQQVSLQGNVNANQ